MAATKKFECVLEDFDVVATKVPSEFRIEFEGPEAVGPIMFAYGTPEAEMVAEKTFNTDGDYIGKFALYDDKGEVLGHMVQTTFSVVSVPTTKTIRVASELIATTVVQMPPATPRRK